MALDDVKCPTYWIIAQLMARGWRWKAERVVHALTDDDGGTTARIMDSRDPMTKKLYYVVLSELDSHLERMSQIASGMVQSYYRLILKGESPPLGLCDADYKRMLKGMAPSGGSSIVVHGGPVDDDQLVFALPDNQLLPIDDPIPGDPSSGDEDDEDLVCAPVHAQSPPLPPPPSPTLAAGDDAEDAGDDLSLLVMATGLQDQFEWYDCVGGGKFRLDKYRPRNRPAYIRIIFSCPRHRDCIKKRSISDQCTRHGMHEPFGYLVLWRDMHLFSGHCEGRGSNGSRPPPPSPSLFRA